MPTPTENLNNSNLFLDNLAGDYSYYTTSSGKSASGQLTLDYSVARDPVAQRTAGGEDRRTAGNPFGIDDGGHLIGNRFGGSSGEENLTAQDRTLNRSDYKRMENSWATQLQQGDKIYVNVESFNEQGSQRPSAYMGYFISEHTNQDGTSSRHIDYFSFVNESHQEQESWNNAETIYYQSHPEEITLQMSQNTTQEYVWNDEVGVLESNPYYESMSPVGQDSTGSYESMSPIGLDSTDSYESMSPVGQDDSLGLTFYDSGISENTSNEMNTDNGIYV